MLLTAELPRPEAFDLLAMKTIGAAPTGMVVNAGTVLPEQGSAPLSAKRDRRRNRPTGQGDFALVANAYLAIAGDIAAVAEPAICDRGKRARRCVECIFRANIRIRCIDTGTIYNCVDGGWQCDVSRAVVPYCQSVRARGR